MTTRYAFFALLVLVAACDSADPSPFGKPAGDPPPVDPPPTPTVIEPLAEALLDINALTLRVNNRGEITDGRWQTPTGENIGTIFRTGLWVSAVQTGEMRNGLVFIGHSTQGPSSFTSERKGGPFGTYYLERDAELENPEAWPVSEGAPVNNDGSPRVYGDAMVWTSMTVEAGPTGSVYERPIEGLRVNQAVFAHDNATEPDVVFVRYELLNTTRRALTDVAIGHWGDFDLVDFNSNRTGFDADAGISYTYLYETVGNSGQAPLISVSFLDRPTGSPLLSHRIMRKGNFCDPDFGSIGFNTPEQVALALRGFSNSGQPMVNPETSQETAFAFTGDPASETGWLDQCVRDSRGLISTGPVTLAPGEEISFTLALVAVEGPTIGEALADLRTRVNTLRATPSVWQFD